MTLLSEVLLEDSWEATEPMAAVDAAKSNTNHPVVQDFQLLSLAALVILVLDASSSWTWWGLVFATIWDGYFWTTLFCVPLSILLPWFSLYLLSNPVTLYYIESDSFWRTIKRWCESTTIFIWVPAFFYGMDFYNDKYLPFLMLLQWLVLPLNTL